MKYIKIFALSFFCLCFCTSVVLAAMNSGSYQINTDSINFGGAAADSASYRENDTLGEIGTGNSSSSSYNLKAGFQQTAMDYSIAIICDSSVTMGEIVGTGQSNLATNESHCNIRTDNPAGYSLTFSAGTEYMENGNSDQIPAYTPTVAGTPEQWSVASTDSEWGARLKRQGSSTYDQVKWGDAIGTEDYQSVSTKWHNITSPVSFTVVSKATETSDAGDDEIIQFGAEIGAAKWQPTGTYDVNVTMTAIAL